MKDRADVVAIGPHPDDVEMAMGGTIGGLVRRGYKVVVIDLTDGEPTPHGTPALRRREARKSAEILGVGRITLDLPNRKLFDTVEGREALAGVLRRLKPWLMFAPYPRDAHPDHWAGSVLSMAGRFYGKLTKTKMPGTPWMVGRVLFHFGTQLRQAPEPALIVDVGEDHRTKIKALAAYRSQFHASGRWKGMQEAMEIRGRFYGNLIGVRYGEPFYVWEPLGIEDPGALVIPGWGELQKLRGQKR